MRGILSLIVFSLIASLVLVPTGAQAEPNGGASSADIVLALPALGPGSPEKLVAAIPLPEDGGAGILTAPANDNIGSATVIGGLPYTAAQSTAEATLQSGEQRPCGLIGSTVWFRFTAASTSLMRMDTFGSNFDTVVAVYKGTSLTSLNVGCNDDAPGGSLQSELTVGIAAGSTYSIQVGGFNSATGSLSLSVSLEPACGSNDFHGNPCTVADVPYTNAQSTAGYSLELGELQPCGNIGATAWYRYTPNFGGTVNVNTFGSTFDTVVAVYVSVGGQPVPLASTGGLVCNDDSSSTLQSSVSFSATGGVTYLFQIGGFGGATGSLIVNVS